MIDLTAQEIAHVVLNFWSGDLIFNRFADCQTVEEALVIFQIVNNEKEKEKSIKFLEALRKYVIYFLEQKKEASSFLVFNVDEKPNETFYYVASAHNVKLPRLPEKHTLILEKSFIEVDREKKFEVILQTKQGYGTFWYRQKYNLLVPSLD